MCNKTEELLFELCNKPNADLAEIEIFIRERHATPEEITRAAIRLADKNALKVTEFEYDHKCLPNDNDLVTSNWIALFEIFLKYGLMPNYIMVEGSDEDNIMQEIRYIDNGDVAPSIMRMLLEHGGNPNLIVGGEDLFKDLDFDIVFDVIEQNNKRIFDIEFRIWLVMMGYGGRIDNHDCPVNLKSGYTVEIFKIFEDFDYRIEFLQKDWKLHIFYKSNGDEVATL